MIWSVHVGRVRAGFNGRSEYGGAASGSARGRVLEDLRRSSERPDDGAAGAGAVPQPSGAGRHADRVAVGPARAVSP